MSGRRYRLVNTMTTVAFVLALVLAGLMMVPGLLGLRRYVIATGSMAPTIPRGSIIYDELTPVEDLEVGDIITFVPPPEYHIDRSVTHRIISIETGAANSNAPGERIIRTQGDANDAPDAWNLVLDNPRQPRVAHHLPWIGFVYLALDHRWVQLLVVGLPALLIVIVLVVSLWRLAGEAVLEERAEGQAPP